MGDRTGVRGRCGIWFGVGVDRFVDRFCLWESIWRELWKTLVLDLCLYIFVSDGCGVFKMIIGV